MKIWTNNGTRGCSNPTKPSTGLPSISVLPSSILPKDDVNVFVAFPMNGKFWPLQSTFYSFSEDLDK
jgi:hypothetical protein